MNLHEAMKAYEGDRAHFEAAGIYLHGVKSYIPDGFKHNYELAMDAQPQLVTDPNSAIPSMLTAMIDPTVYRVLFAPTKAAEIFGEVRKGDWTMDTAMFPIVEHTGEVSSYDDYSNNGSTGVNTNWPMKQNYIFQTIKQYGEREMERAGLAKINWLAELDMAAVTVLNRFANFSYLFGILGLQNNGLLNDPNLSAALTPTTKAAGGTKWVQNGVVVATANEIYADIESVFVQLVAQSGGQVDRETKMTLALSPQSEAALTATNSFAVNVSDLLKKNFPNLKVISAVQYGVSGTANPQGIAAGNLMQLIATEIAGQPTGFMAFSEKMRSHPIVKGLSSFKQKITAGTWGAVVRGPFGIAQMIGI